MHEMANRNNLTLLDLDVVFATAHLMTAKLTSILQRFLYCLYMSPQRFLLINLLVA